MMTDEQRARAAELAAVIAATAATATGTPPEVRAEAVALKEEVRRDGTTARVLAAALGVHESTLYRWERGGDAIHAPAKPSRGAGFRMVQVASPAAPPVSVSPPLAHGIRVAHAPSGLVIDGLDVATLAALLRRMS